MWHLRFLDLAKHISNWSKDPSTKVGAVIFDSDKRIISVGYNGFPKNISDDPEKYLNREIKYQMVVHAEINAILFAQRNLKDFLLQLGHLLDAQIVLVQKYKLELKK